MSRSGRRTLKALRAFTSNPSICKLAKIELTTLKQGKKKIIIQLLSSRLLDTLQEQTMENRSLSCAQSKLIC